MKAPEKPKWRITSLERWGMRSAHDFQPESCAFVKEAGYNAVLVNGGSGIGPDMMTPESLVETSVLPGLMPRTVHAHRQAMNRRCVLLRQAELAPWLCVWGVSGPDESSGGEAAESNRFFDRRTKLEMQAQLERTPDLFGHRHPGSLSWRGSRPLCISHPVVQTFYRELYRRIPEEYPDLSGIFFFPGDTDPECCDETCDRCRATGLDAWDRLLRHINDLYRSLQEVRPGLPFYVALWNLPDSPMGRAKISRFIESLAPGIGVAMSLSDVSIQQRKSGPMIFNQPWSIFSEAGDLFLWTHQQANRLERPVMVLGEISQSEVWDPVCHNMPTPLKTLKFLRQLETLKGVEALLDFWGNRSPFIPHTNHAIMREWLADPRADDGTLLARAAARHYSIPESTGAESSVLAAWRAWDDAVDHWALCIWGQRFSYAIGRDAARGKLYFPLIPPFLNQRNWGLSQLLKHPCGVEAFQRYQEEDRQEWGKIAHEWESLATALSRSSPHGARLAKRESGMIALAAELIPSIGRTASAVTAWQQKDASALRALVDAEIEARERQLELSGRVGWGAGVNPILVSEDLQNMRLFLSSRGFPDVSPDRFHWTPCPFSI